ncbi:hypothetical protein [Streptomyces spiramyceticus]|uniref:hypothetical protein n=1 Tax=Streptomyces spiramyceticus TaxID=299717 RepID=UPI00237A61E1|nr:hypothetical protein [Streptomyces spiramyceticus]
MPAPGGTALQAVGAFAVLAAPGLSMDFPALAPTEPAPGIGADAPVAVPLSLCFTHLGTRSHAAAALKSS